MVLRALDSLRVRLLLLVAVAILPGVAALAISAIEVRNTSVARARNELDGISNFLATEQGRVFRRAERFLGDLGEQPWVATSNAAECSDSARQIIRGERAFDFLGAIDLEGKIFCGSRRIPPDLDMSGHPLFRRVMADRRFLLDAAPIGILGGRPEVSFAKPARDGAQQGGPVRAVLFITLDPDWLERLVANTRLPEGTTVVIFDVQGTVVGHYPEPATWIGRSVRETSLFRTVTARQKGVVDDAAIDDTPRIFAFDPVDRVPAGGEAYTAIGHLPAAVFGDVDAIFARSLTVTLVVAVLALLGAGVFSTLLILRPVAVLVDASRRLAAGDLGARTGVSRPHGELGELLQAFDEMAQTLEHGQERMRQMEKMEAVGRLAGGIAHDFNNLLTSIIGFGRLLQETEPNTEPEREYLSQIIRAGERAAQLTRQLLIFSRKKPLTPEVVDLNAIVKEMGTLLRRIIGEDVELTTVLAPRLGLVRVDPAQIEQVILNLATNARDAMPTGGKLTIETASARLDELFVRDHPGARPGPHAMLAVTDTGVGMSRETQERIFEPFFTTKEVGKGTGLGLATVFGVVQEAGGSVWVYSEPGHGATFKIYLPLAEEAIEAVEPISDVGLPLAAGGQTVLLVEDDESVRRLTRTVLEGRGYRVLEASGAEEALHFCAENPKGIDLLLTDIVLPGHSGRQIAEEVARICPSAQVLYMSGYTDDAVVRHGLLGSEIAYLEKPFSPIKLEEMVAAALHWGNGAG